MSVHVRVLSLLALAAAVTIVACGDDDASGPNVGVTETYLATLNGANERPNPVTTNGVGTARLDLYGNDSIFFDVKIGQIDSVTLSHIHRGDVSVAGPIIYGWPNNVPVTSVPAVKQFHLGMIRRTSTFSGAFTFDSLLTHIRAGTAYANVHTRRNGGGEIRGNLVKQ